MYVNTYVLKVLNWKLQVIHACGKLFLFVATIWIAYILPALIKVYTNHCFWMVMVSLFIKIPLYQMVTWIVQ